MNVAPTSEKVPHFRVRVPTGCGTLTPFGRGPNPLDPELRPRERALSRTGEDDPEPGSWEGRNVSYPKSDGESRSPARGRSVAVGVIGALLLAGASLPLQGCAGGSDSAAPPPVKRQGEAPGLSLIHI